MNLDLILNSQITVSMIVGIMLKMAMVLLLLLALVMVRQAGLMNRVVNLSVGGNIRLLVWSFFGLMIILTAIVVLV